MLNDSFTELDQLFRSAMEGAEEVVPSGVWSSVCDQLDKLAAPLAGAAAGMAGAKAAASSAGASSTGASSTGAAAAGASATSGAAGTAAGATATVATASHTVGIIAGTVAAVGVGVTSVAILHNSNDDHIEEPVPVTEFVQDPIPQELPDDTIELVEVIRRTARPVAVEPEPAPREEPVEMLPEEPEQAAPESEPETKPEPKHREPRPEPANPAPKKTFGLDIHFGLEPSGFSSTPFVLNSISVYEARTKESATIQEVGESDFKTVKSFGLGARLYLSRHWSIGTGLSYMKLERTFDGTYWVHGIDETPNSASIRNEQHYVGIPLDIYYNFLDNRKWELYVFGGGMIEKCLFDKYRADSRANIGSYFRNDVTDLQKSLNFGLGLEYRIYNHVGVYVSPAVRYYLESGQPNSIRVREPWRLGVEGGVRFWL